VSKYIRLAVHEIDFDGDHVVASLRPLKLKHLLRFQSMDDRSGEAIAALFAEILPEYVESLQGLTDAAGSPVTIGEVCDVTYFAPLLVELGEKLVAGATVDRPPSPGASSAG
jgi:hypothetical protein